VAAPQSPHAQPSVGSIPNPPFSSSSEKPVGGDGGSKPSSGRGSGNICSTTDGIFGSTDGKLILVSFGYELETTTVDDFDLVQEVLPPLEAAFTNYLLPLLFEGECSDDDGVVASVSSSGSSLGHRGLRRLGQFVGISALPDDLPILDVVCSKALKAEGNVCTVMLGELRLYLNEDRRLSVESDVKDALKEGMENNAFNSAEERIVRVGYLDLASVDTSIQGGGNGNPPSGGGGVNSILVGFVVVAAAGTILIGVLFAYRRRSRNQQHNMAFPLNSGFSSSLPDTPDSGASSKNSMIANRGTGLGQTENAAADEASTTSVYLEGSDAGGGGGSALPPSALTQAIDDDDNQIYNLRSPTDDSVYIEENGDLFKSSDTTTVVHDNKSPHNSGRGKDYFV